MAWKPNAEQSNAVFYLPDLGEGLEEAELLEWCVDVGQKVAENDTLAKMETAKALVEVPSPRAGIIATLHGRPGQAIKVGAPLVTFKITRSSEASSATPETIPGNRHEKTGNGKQVATEQTDAGSVVGSLGNAPTSPSEGKRLAAPAVRRLARDMGVAIDDLTGTGIGGRITSQDVQAAAQSHSVSIAQNESTSDKSISDTLHGPIGREPISKPLVVGNVRVPFRGVRKTIAENLRYSVSHAVHFTVMDEADVTALDALRRKLVAASNEKISLLPFVALAVCQVLSGNRGMKFARLNSTVDDEKQEIVQHRTVHLGIATDTESGLMVPVIFDAQRLGVLQISRRVAELAQAARDRTLKPEQLHGSTFTISNFGAMEGRFGTPIINYPEAGILAIGRAREGVVVRDGMLGVGKLLPLSLSADHRVIDGAAAATALAKIIDLLQSPEELLPSAEAT